MKLDKNIVVTPKKYICRWCGVAYVKREEAEKHIKNHI